MDWKCFDMSQQVVKEIIIPKCEGKSFRVNKGQILRLIAIDGPQAADLIAFNPHDMRESLSAWLSRHLNHSFTKAEYLYTKLPAGNVMFKVLTQLDGVFWLSPGRCNRFSYEMNKGVHGYHKNCQDILAGCIKEYGLSDFDVPEVVNLFMNAKLHEDGTYEFLESPVKQGDYVEMEAKMDSLVAVSACPDELSAYNAFEAKRLKIEVIERK